MASRKLCIFASLLLTCVSSSYANLIGDICSKPTSPSSCNQILTSDPLIVNAQRDVITFGNAVINKAIITTNAAPDTVGSLAKKETNPKLKASLTKCVANFGDAINKFNGAKNSLKNKDRKSLNGQALAAVAAANSCNGNFQGLVEPVTVKIATENVQVVANIVVSLSTIV